MKTYSSQAVKWHERYNLAASQQEPLFKKFSAWFDIAYTVYPSDRKTSPWRSKVLFPTLGNKAWQLAAKFVGLKPGWQAQAEMPYLSAGMPAEDIENVMQLIREQEEKAQRKLEQDYDNPEMDEAMRDKLLAVMMDAIIAGTGVGKAPWTVKTKTRYERQMDDYGQPVMTEEKVIKKTTGYNDFIPVNIFNLFIAPSAANLYSAPWVIIKEYKTLAQLQSENETNGGKFFKNLDLLKDAKADSDRFAQYKASRNRIVASSDPAAIDTTIAQLPVYECHDLDNQTICWYVDSGNQANKQEPWIILREQKNVYWHGKYPLVAFYVKKKPHDFWGLGIFQTNERVDAGKNDLFNHYLDEWNIAASGGVIAEEGSIINDYLIEPGFEMTYKQGSTKPEQWKFPEPNPNQLVTLNTILDRAIEDGTISPYSAGSPNSALDSTAGTKGGILAIQQQADDILGFGRSNFRTSITQLGKFFLSNDQQFMDEPITLDSPDGSPVQISPGDLQGKINLTVTEDSMQPLSKEQMLQQFESFTGQLLQMQAASLQQATTGAGKPLVLNFPALAQEMGDKFGVQGFDRFVLSDQEVQQQLQQQAMMAQQQQADQLQQQQAVQQQADGQKQTGQADQAVNAMTADLAARGHLDPNALEQPVG